MAEKAMDLSVGVKALQKNAAAAGKVLGGLEKQIQGMCSAMTSLFENVSPAKTLSAAEKAVKRTTTTVRKESQKALAAFDEIDRIDTDNTTTTVTTSVTTSTTEQSQGTGTLAQDTEVSAQYMAVLAKVTAQLSKISLTPLIAGFQMLQSAINKVQATLMAGIGNRIAAELTGIQMAANGITAAISNAKPVALWLEATGNAIGGIAGVASSAAMAVQVSFSKIFIAITEGLGSAADWITQSFLPKVAGAVARLGNIFSSMSVGVSSDTSVPVWLETTGIAIGGLADAASLLEMAVEGKFATIFTTIGKGLGNAVVWITREFIPAVTGGFRSVVTWISQSFIPAVTGGFRSVVTWISQSFIPAVTGGIGKLGTVFSSIGTWIGNGAKAVVQGFLDIGGAIGNAIAAAGRMAAQIALGAAAWVKETALKTANTVATWAQVAATTAWNALCAVATTVTTAFGAAMTFLTSPIGLVVAAIAALIAIVVLLVKNWDTVKAAALSVWETIEEVFGNAWKWFEDTLLDPLAEGFKSMVNGIIGFLNGMIAGIVKGINAVIGALNKLKFEVPEWVPGLGGETLGFNLKTVTAPQIPLLAQGAVLPANKPFLAVVGDQKHGTNVEAPLETIQQALANVLASRGTGDIRISFTGDLAQLGRVLKPVVEREDRRVGGSLVKEVFA